MQKLNCARSIQRRSVFVLKCPACRNKLIWINNGYICDSCRREYPLIKGVVSFSDCDLLSESYYPGNAFEELYHAESTNFWFRVRNQIIGCIIKKYLPVGSNIIEVGCGTGFVSTYLKSQGYEMDCADLYLQGLHYCIKRAAGGSYYQFNLYDSIFYEHYDGVCAFDVIEHIDDDSLVLKNMNAALKPGGFIVITVPASKRLWSEVDESARHKRRYDLAELKGKVETAGFEIKEISYFMTLLYPFIYISRRMISMNGIHSIGQASRSKASSEICINHLLNNIFFHIFNAESYILSRMKLPFGSSLLCIAQKRIK